MERLRRAWAQAKREADLREEEKGGKEASDGVVCDSEYVSVYENAEGVATILKIQRTCAGPKRLTEDPKAQVRKIWQITFGRTRHGEKSG